MIIVKVPQVNSNFNVVKLAVYMNQVHVFGALVLSSLQEYESFFCLLGVIFWLSSCFRPPGPPRKSAILMCLLLFLLHVSGALSGHLVTVVCLAVAAMERTSSLHPSPKSLPAFAACGPTSCASPMYRPPSKSLSFFYIFFYIFIFFIFVFFGLALCLHLRNLVPIRVPR